MRVTSAIWFAVFMKREADRGAFVTVVKKGAQQAGAIFVLHHLGMDVYDVYGPAPQSLSMEADSDRRFERVKQEVPRTEVNLFIEKQVQFDPDLWVIETEAGTGAPSVECVS